MAVSGGTGSFVELASWQGAGMGSFDAFSGQVHISVPSLRAMQHRSISMRCDCPLRATRITAAVSGRRRWH
jgi:hypothetical protein